MYRNLLSHDLFAQLDRLQRFAHQSLDISPGIGGLVTHQFPAINVSTSPQAVEVNCLAPGIEPDKLEIKLERNVLSIAGERKDTTSNEGSAKANVHIGERFTGRFHRVVTLPDDVDGNAVTARYRDGVLSIKAPRREAEQPRRITIQ